MSAQNQKISIEKLVRLIGVASVSVLFSFPALAITTSNSNSFDGSLNNHTRRVDSSGKSTQLLAQDTPGTGGTGSTGAGQNGTGGMGPGGTGAGQNGTGGTSGTGAGQNGTGGTGMGGSQTGGGTGGTGTGGSQTGGGTGGTGTGGSQTGGGTGGTGTGGSQTGGGTGGTGTGGTGAGGTPSSRQSNGRQDAFTQNMNAGYTATQQRNYQNALAYFQRALQLRPGNPYARRAVQNVQSYLRRGNSATQTNQGSR